MPEVGRWWGPRSLRSIPTGQSCCSFPISMLQRSDVLRTILEWQAPTYDTIWQKLFLVQIAVAVVVLVRRPTWRLALPFVVFVPASLYSARNILVASLVLTAAMAPCLAGVGDLKANARLSSTPLAWMGAFVMAALCAVTLTTPLGKPALDLSSYPVAALAYLDANDLVPPADGSEGRLLAQDFVGNLREYLDGPVRDVFIDDRAEVIGEQASADYISLLGGAPELARRIGSQRHRGDRLAEGLRLGGDPRRVTRLADPLQRPTVDRGAAPSAGLSADDHGERRSQLAAMSEVLTRVYPLFVSPPRN